MTLYLCVITYQYPGREPYELPSKPTSKTHAMWLFDEQPRLFDGNDHIVRAAVYSEADYREHQLRRRVAETALVAL